MPRTAWICLALLAPAARADELTVIAEKKWAHKDFAGVGLGHAVFTPDGKRLITQGYACVRVWDLTADPPKEKCALTGLKFSRSGVGSIAVSADGKTLAVCGGGKPNVRLYRLGDDKLEEFATLDDMNGVRSVAFSPDGKMMATGSDGQPIWVYDLVDGKPKERTTFKPKGAGSAVNSLHFLPDSKGLAFWFQGGRGNVGIQDVSGKESVTLEGAATLDAVPRGALSPDGKLLAAFGKSKDRKDGSIRLYDVDGGKLTERMALDKHTRSGQGLSFSADGAYLASSAKDSRWMVWRVKDGSLLISKLRSGDINDVNINPVTPPGADVQLVHTTQGREVHLITLKLSK